MRRSFVVLAAVVVAGCLGAPIPSISTPAETARPTPTASVGPTEVPAAHGRIAFIRTRTGAGVDEGVVVKSNIFIIAADGSNVRQLTDDNRWHLHLYWLTDGSRLVSVWERLDDPYHQFLTSMLPDGSEQRDLGPVQEGDYPTRSPDGRYIAFGGDGSQKGDSGTVLLDLATGRRIQLTVDGAAQPLWSPDSTKVVAFVTGKKLAVYDVPRGTVTFELRADVDGVFGWTPDGQGVLYRVCTPNDNKVECMNARVTLAKLDGSPPVPYVGSIPTMPDGLISPDGKWIANADPAFTNILRSADAKEIDVTAAGEDERIASWAPDSVWLATTQLVKAEGQQTRIVLRSPYLTRTADAIPVTEGPSDTAPAWQP